MVVVVLGERARLRELADYLLIMYADYSTAESNADLRTIVSDCPREVLRIGDILSASCLICFQEDGKLPLVLDHIASWEPDCIKIEHGAPAIPSSW